MACTAAGSKRPVTGPSTGISPTRSPPTVLRLPLDHPPPSPPSPPPPSPPSWCGGQEAAWGKEVRVHPPPVVLGVLGTPVAGAPLAQRYSVCLHSNRPGFQCRCRHGEVSRSSPTSDFKIGTPVSTLPGAWRYRVSAGTGWLGVSTL